MSSQDVASRSWHSASIPAVCSAMKAWSRALLATSHFIMPFRKATSPPIFTW